MLDLILLVLPLLVLCVAYILITRTLYVGMDVGKDARLHQLSGGGASAGNVGMGAGGAIAAAGGGGGSGAQAVATATIAATPGSSSCILVLNAPAEYNGNGKLRSGTVRLRYDAHTQRAYVFCSVLFCCHPQRAATIIIVEHPGAQPQRH